MTSPQEKVRSPHVITDLSVDTTYVFTVDSTAGQYGTSRPAPWTYLYLDMFSKYRLSALVSCRCCLTYGRNISHIKGNSTLVLMYSGFEMGISSCAMLILCLNHIGELQLFVFFTHYSIVLFHFFFLCVCHS